MVKYLKSSDCDKEEWNIYDPISDNNCNIVVKIYSKQIVNTEGTIVNDSMYIVRVVWAKE